MDVLAEIKENIAKSIESLGFEISPSEIIESRVSDLETRIAFKLAKKLRKPPAEIAEEIVSELNNAKPKYVEKIEAKNGYVNFYLDYSYIAKEFLSKVIKQKENVFVHEKKREKVVIDFSCPNPGKPMHIGHVRSTVIGDCLCRINRYLGYDVVASNYMNDRGLHMGKLMAAIELWGIPPLEEIKEPEKFLMQLYVKFNQEAEKNPELNKKAHEWVQKIDQGDARALMLLNKIYEVSWKGFEETYNRLNVKFDEVVRETQVVNIGKELVKEALDKGIAFKAEEGQIVADLEKYGLPSTVILRSDGTALYITSDMGLAKYRYEKHHFDRMIYVTANEQNLHFKQVFKILELLGYDWIKKCEHVGFGLIFLPEGKISTRKGRVVFLKDVLDRIVNLAKEEIKKREYIENDIDDVAEKIAIAALRFAILSVDNNKEIHFDWNKILNFDGKTGPYLLYSYVRANSILEKISKDVDKFDVSELTSEEINLLRKLISFESIVKSSSKSNQPHTLANYLFELAKAFTEFYHNNKVIGSEKENFRIALVFAFKLFMKKGLELLGIKPVERM